MARRGPRRRIARDSLIVGFALGAGAYEIVLGGGRPSVLTFLVTLLLSPLVLRFDEAKREDGDR